MIKSMIPEFVKGQMLSPDVLVDALTAKSLTDLKYKVKKAMAKQKAENNQMMQLSQQLEQANQQLQQLQQEL